MQQYDFWQYTLSNIQHKCHIKEQEQQKQFVILQDLQNKLIIIAM